MNSRLANDLLQFIGVDPSPATEPFEVNCVDRFEDAWESHARPRIDAFLPTDGPTRLATLIELVYIDLERRLWSGEPARIEQYLHEFPELLAERTKLPDSVFAECELRSRKSDPPLREELDARFPALAAEIVIRLQQLAGDGSDTAASQVGAADTSIGRLTLRSGRRTSDDTSGHAPAQTIPGYELISELGRGGSAVVYLARQSGLDRLVAVKLLTGAAEHDRDLVRRFRNEAATIARLRHPHIVQVHDIGDVGGRPYLVLEYLASGTLQARLDRQPLEALVGAALIRILAEAVSAAHQQGIIHRDLKPANVLFTETDVAKIADFGLASYADADERLTRTGDIVGTPSYMAPEQVTGQPELITAAVDVYALGAILYAALTGRPPFRAASIFETLEQVQTTEPVPPRDLVPRLPRDLETICLKCLDKRPERRYASPIALADDLTNFLAARPITARPIGSLGRLVRWARRQPVVAGLTSAVAILLVAVTIGASFAALRINESRRTAELTAERETLARREAEALRVTTERNLLEIKNRDRQMWRSVYAANSRRAFEAHAGNEPETVKKLLFENLPTSDREDLRGFEWYYLWRQANVPDYITLPAQGGPAYFVTYSPDGKLILAGTLGGIVNIWDAATYEPIHRWKAHESCVNDIRFSPDRTLIATTSCDKTARLWRTTDWQPASKPMRRDQAIFRSAFLPDGQTLITGTDPKDPHDKLRPEITLWNVATAEPKASIRATTGSIRDLFVALEGRRLVAINNHGIVQHWEIDGDSLREIPHPETLDWQHSSPTAMAYDSTTNQLVYNSYRAGVELMNLQSNTTRSWNRPGVSGSAFAFSPGGDRIAHVNQASPISVRNTADGELLETLYSPDSRYSLCFSPDGTHLAGAAEIGHIYLCRLGNPARAGHRCLLPTTPTINPTRSLRSNQDGTVLWFSDRQFLVSVDRATGTQQQLFGTLGLGNLLNREIAPDESVFAISTEKRGETHYYLVRRVAGNVECRIVAEFDSELIPQFDRRSQRLAGYSNGKLWIRAATDGQILREVVAPERLVSPLDPLGSHGQLSWFDGGKSVIAPLRPECLRCDLATGTWTRLGPATSLAIAVEAGPYVVKRQGGDASVSIVNGHTGSPVLDLRLPKYGVICSLSPDGRRLAAVGDRTAQIFDVESGQELGVLFRSESSLSMAQFSGDGRTLVVVNLEQPNRAGVATYSFVAATPDEASQRSR